MITLFLFVFRLAPCFVPLTLQVFHYEALFVRYTHPTMGNDFIGSTFAIRQMTKRTMMMEIVRNKPCWRIQRINLVHQVRVVLEVVAHSKAFIFVAAKSLWLRYEETEVTFLFLYRTYHDSHFFSFYATNIAVLGLLGCCTSLYLNGIILCDYWDRYHEDFHWYFSSCSGM